MKARTNVSDFCFYLIFFYNAHALTGTTKHENEITLNGKL